MKMLVGGVCTAILMMSWGCKRGDAVPVPAISFYESIEDLKLKESHHLYDEDLLPGPPGSFSYTLQTKYYTYTTDGGDTLTYKFIRNHLSYVLITMKDKSYEDVVKGYKQNPNAHQLYDNIFKMKDDIIRVGIEHGRFASLLYLNDVDGEVSFFLNQDYFQKVKVDSSYRSNDLFVVQLGFAVYGRGRYSCSTDSFNFYEGLYFNR